MGKKIHHDPAKVSNMPKGSLFVQLSYELINSIAWRYRSINCIRLIDFLILENISHRGLQNGYLLAPYDQLEEFGIARGYISSVISEAEFLGLITLTRGRRRGYANSDCNKFMLTFLRSKQPNKITGGFDYIEPSNEWRAITAEDIKNRKQGMRLYKEKKKAKNLKSKV